MEWNILRYIIEDDYANVIFFKFDSLGVNMAKSEIVWVDEIKLKSGHKIYPL